MFSYSRLCYEELDAVLFPWLENENQDLVKKILGVKFGGLTQIWVAILSLPVLLNNDSHAMLRPIINAVAPAIKLGSLALSVGNNGWLIASDFAISKGFPPETFNVAHHVLSSYGLLIFTISARMSGESLASLDKILQMIFLVASSALFELTRRSNPGVIQKRSERPLEEHPGRFILCDTCNVYQPYRSYHCRKCDQCVERFDHHCIWTNCCIGANNLRYLVLLLFTSILALLFTSIQAFNALLLSEHLFWQLVFVSTASFYGFMLYPVGAFFITLITSISINVSSTEMRGKLHGSQEYLSIVPYFNSYDFGSDYNFRALFNAYSSERKRWTVPSPISKLLATLPAKNSPHSHNSGDACGHDHSQAPSATTSQTQRPSANRPSTASSSSTTFARPHTEAPLSTSRPISNSVIGDQNV